ncbi:MAG TPA: hypothetical protein VKB93_17400 [Thermoanaerobaculia bacterium]|nr:hypothetical protein [Thermoanaerobaculia bacterium]
MLLLLAALPLAGAPKKRTPIAPAAVPHPIALFLNQLSNEGKRQVTFRASALGTRFYFEESGGVTVYQFVDGQYVKEVYLPGVNLAIAMKRYKPGTR